MLMLILPSISVIGNDLMVIKIILLMTAHSTVHWNLITLLSHLIIPIHYVLKLCCCKKNVNCINNSLAPTLPFFIRIAFSLDIRKTPKVCILFYSLLFRFINYAAYETTFINLLSHIMEND